MNTIYELKSQLNNIRKPIIGVLNIYTYSNLAYRNKVI